MRRSDQRRRLGSDDTELDRLSSLPDALLVNILSLLAIQTAGSTSVLSRRWRNLWTQLPHLVFDGRYFPPFQSGTGQGDREWRFYATIEHILQRLISPKIDSFYLRVIDRWVFCRPQDSLIHASYIVTWLRQLSARDIEDIELISNPDGASIPVSGLFRSKSLKSLKLVGLFSVEPPDDGILSLPNLKTLHLTLSLLDSDSLSNLFRVSPQLEELVLRGQFTGNEHCCLDLSAHKLKLLDVRMLKNQPPVKFVINASKLEQLSIYAPTLASYHLIGNSTTLLTADIRLESRFIEGNDYLSSTTDLAQLISCVRSLRLNATMLKALNNVGGGGDCRTLFNNLTELRVKLHDPHVCWNNVLVFLHCCPSLEVLVISLAKGNMMTTQEMSWAKPDSVPPCLLARLKRVRIKRLRGTASADVQMMKFILCNSKVLELLSVHVRVTSLRRGTRLWKEYHLCEQLFLFPRTSETCEIKFAGSFLSTSSKNFGYITFDCQINRFG